MFKEFLQGRGINHPLHPIFVHIPVGAWLVSLIMDVVYLIGGNPTFALASFYCMVIGLCSVAFAAPTGLAEYFSIPANTKPKQLATAHMVLNLWVTALYIINVFIRSSQMKTLPPSVTAGTFVLSLISYGFLAVSGYIGGLLVYNYGIGFKPQLRQGKEKPAKPYDRRAA